jgi:Flp pilus assembly protein TadG
MLVHTRSRRRGTTLVELALIYPLTFLLTLGMVVGALGIAKYNEVAYLAREAARYASTHGGQYAFDGAQKSITGPNAAAWQTQMTNEPAVSSNTNLTNYVTSRAMLLDPTQLSISVSWTVQQTHPEYTPPNYPNYADTTVDANGVPAQTVIYNNVIVTISYDWTPEVFTFLGGPFHLSSTSQIPMQY